MTQIDASPMPTGKIAAKADAGALRDRGKGGQADGDAGLEGGKPRFGDHWRSILSGDGGKAGEQPASPEEGGIADEGAPSKRFGVLFRLPPAALAQARDAAPGEMAAPDAAAVRRDEIDIAEALAALKGAGADGGEATLETAGGIAIGAHAGNAGSIAPDAIVADGEGSAVASADIAAGDIAVEQAARGVAIHPAMANAAAQSTASGSAEPSPPADAKARARTAMADASLEKSATNATSDIQLATRADAARPAMKATVMHQATHFAPALAPALGPANIQAISGALTTAAGDLRHGAERAGTDSAMHQPGRSVGPVKTLTIQLTPVSLGKLTVEMRLIDGAMKVDIQVADAKALELVRADKDLIMNLLRKAGVTPDTVTIQTADNASTARQNQAGQGAASGSGFDREASRDGSDGSGRHSGRDDTDQGRRTHDDRSIDPSRLRGDIYL